MVEKGDWPRKGMRKILGVVEMFYILIVMMVTWVYILVKAHLIVGLN